MGTIRDNPMSPTAIKTFMYYLLSFHANMPTKHYHYTFLCEVFDALLCDIFAIDVVYNSYILLTPESHNTPQVVNPNESEPNLFRVVHSQGMRMK